MINNIKKALRKHTFGLAFSEVDFAVRGFDPADEAQSRLELVGKTVALGYNFAIEHSLNNDFIAVANMVKKELVGFFFEGAGMGMYVLDLFSYNKDLFKQFQKGLGKPHTYMLYIGAGLGMAVFNRPFESYMVVSCPVRSCLVIDGIGFYNAFFKTPKGIGKQYVPKKIASVPFYHERYDNGVGRAIWFKDAGDPEKIANTINAFPEERRGAIWSGVGLAATYARGVEKHKYYQLKTLAGEHLIMLAQGCVLGVHTRCRAGNPHQVDGLIDDSIELILVGLEANKCHEIANTSMNRLLERGDRVVDGKPAFQVFLEDIRESITHSTEMFSEKEVV